MTQTDSPNFAGLLATALTEPGQLSAAYRAFHNYSLGNQILAWSQCKAREIPIGPLASFNRWKDLGRHVTKGQKAIELCMPITCKTTDKVTGEESVFTRFTFKRNWFVLAQTEGAEYVDNAPAAWDKDAALKALNVTEIPYDHFSGNTQGYATAGRRIAVNPIAAHPFKTTFHELAHILLGHLDGEDTTTRATEEMEAESTAMLVCAALGLPGLADSRGYIQHWYQDGKTIPEASARRILKTADQILKAGQASTDSE